MTDTPMTPEQEYDFYAQPETNNRKDRPAKGATPLSAMVPVRFPKLCADHPPRLR